MITECSNHFVQTDIDKTLAALDHVIGYYHVAEEVEPVIRDGYVHR